MASNVVEDFLVGIGVKTDSSGFKQAADAAAQMEKRITAAQAAEVDKRVDAELKGGKKQLSLKEQLARLVEGLEQDRADRVDAIQREQAERAAKRDEEHLKKVVARRDAVIKSTKELAVGMTSLFASLAVGVTGAATGILWATERAARHFEKLGYAGQMSGSSATGLSRVGYAASQSGTTVEDAQGSAAAFGENLKKLHALEGILKSMGIATREANGQLRDASTLMVEYIDHLKELPQLQREARTGQWGITDTTTRAVLRDGYHGFEREYDRIQGTVGADPNAAARGAIGFEQAIRRGFEIIGAVKTRVETALFDIIKPRLDDVAKWVLDHGDAISNVVTSISKGLTDLATAFVKSDVVQGALSGLGDGLEHLAKYVGSDAFKRDVSGFVEDIKALARAIRSALEWLGILPSRTGAAVPGTSPFGGVDSSSGGLGGSGRHADGGSGPGASLHDRQFHGKGNFGQKGWWTPERQSYAVDYLMKNAGLTEDGAKALVARWRFVESAGGPTSVNPHSGAEGIAQWLDRKGGGSNGTFDEQLAKVSRELNGKDKSDESRAKRLLNTPGMEAVGASQYERAEGYNRQTGEDNYTATVREGMKHIAHGSSATAQAPVPAGASEKAVTDAQVVAARQRILNGSRDPADRAIVNRYLKEQNTPKPAAAADKPVKVEVTEDSGFRLGKAFASASPLLKTPIGGGGSNILAGLHASWQRWAEDNGKHLHHPGDARHPFRAPPLGVTPSLYQAYDNSRRRGDTNITHNPTFHIHGHDVRTSMDSARMAADRGTKDLVRNLKAVEQ